jgi:hypothetical protein
MNKFAGIQCNSIRENLVFLSVLKGLIYFGLPPCWLAEYKYILYSAARNLIRPKGNRKYLDLKIIEGKIIISPRRLILGGAAILITQNINHHIDNIGINSKIPFVKNKLRV